jgi:ubiquinone/menaquinone biosynthesis C-methylase UbiE
MDGMTMSLAQVRRRYAGKAMQEWERLRSTPITRIEYAITSHCLRCHLPPGGLILDAGCGPGRYAIDLAQQGYRVIMLDLLSEMLRLGRDRVTQAGLVDRAPAPVEGDISALPYAEGVFDAVLCLGAPLSHLTEAGMRARAVGEMARVAKAGAPIFLTGIARLAATRGAIYWHNWTFFDQFMTAASRASGIAYGSQVWYMFAPRELEALAERAGLEIVDRVGCEGLAGYLPMRHLAEVEADPKRGPVWREILLETCNEPTIVGISSHLLVIARKRA